MGQEAPPPPGALHGLQDPTALGPKSASRQSAPCSRRAHGELLLRKSTVNLHGNLHRVLRPVLPRVPLRDHEGAHGKSGEPRAEVGRDREERVGRQDAHEGPRHRRAPEFLTPNSLPRSPIETVYGNPLRTRSLPPADWAHPSALRLCVARPVRCPGDRLRPSGHARHELIRPRSSQAPTEISSPHSPPNSDPCRYPPPQALDRNRCFLWVWRCRAALHPQAPRAITV